MNDIIQLRGILVHHHALIEGDQVHLLDGGFLGGIKRIERFLRKRGFDFSNLKSLVISHGHLDHTHNVSRLKKLSGCQVYAPTKDRDLINGQHHYEGWNKLGGIIERIGKPLTRHEIPKVDQWFEEGDTLPILGGLEVIPLPGHTTGHCGFLHREGKLLFANDLFSNQFRAPHPPPRIFNDDHGEALASIVRASELPLRSVFINHGQAEAPNETLLALKQLAASLEL